MIIPEKVRIMRFAQTFTAGWDGISMKISRGATKRREEGHATAAWYP